MGKVQPKAMKCPDCSGYFIPPHWKIALWFRAEGKDIRLCRPCSDLFMAEVTTKLASQKKKLRTIKDLPGKRVIILTDLGDYVGNSVLRPDQVKLVEGATAEEIATLTGVQG